MSNLNFNAEQVKSIVAKIAVLKDEIEAVKPKYDELDELVTQLKAQVPVGVQLFLEDNRSVELVDNFAEKNTVFRPHGVKRFEVSILTAEERVEKAEKAAKAAAKAAKKAATNG